MQAIHVWVFHSLLDQLPDYPWLIKHYPLVLEQSLFKQLVWQATSLAGKVKSPSCDILFTTGASTRCRFKPIVVLSQDMLSYKPHPQCQDSFPVVLFRKIRLKESGIK